MEIFREKEKLTPERSAWSKSLSGMATKNYVSGGARVKICQSA
jgi:hypothetical protein